MIWIRSDNDSNDESDISPSPSCPWELVSGEYDTKTQQKEILARLNKKLSFFSPSKSSRVHWALVLFFLEISIAVLFLLDGTLFMLQHVCNDYAIPLIKLHNWTEMKEWRGGTYLERTCYSSDQTSHDVSELVAHTIEKDIFSQHINLHGVQIIPNLLSDETADELRNFVLEQNRKNVDMFDSVLEGDNRFSFALQVDQHPSVTKAIKELLSNSMLLDAFEAIFGDRDPVVLELVVLTSVYGAKAQEWHPDVPGDTSATKYGLHYFDYYSVFIPLQNTTEAMGPSGICPGTHMCNTINDGYDDLDTCFLVSGEGDVWQTGWGVMYNSRLVHRGSSHVDPTTGKERVLLIPSFAPRPIHSSHHRLETRSIPLGGVYAMHWSQWGHTVSDFRNSDRLMQQPWRTLHSFGLEWPKYYRGWNYWDILVNRMLDEETADTVEDWTTYLEDAFPWIPSYILGEYAEEDKENKSESEKLIEFVMASIKRSRYILRCTQWILLVTFSSLFSVFRKSEVGRHSVLRLFVVNGAIAVMIAVILKLVAGSCWARNISTGRSTNLPDTTSQISNIAATLPYKEDIFITTFLKSRSFGAYSNMVDDNNPGNRYWTEEIVPYYSIGFSNLTVELKFQLCEFVAGTLAHEGRRVLQRNHNGDWGVPSDQEKQRFCYQSLFLESKTLQQHIIEDIDILLAETRFGYFRDTVLHRRILPDHLCMLKDKILHYTATARSVNIKNTKIAGPQSLKLQSFIQLMPSTKGENESNKKKSVVDIHTAPEEPEEGGWLAEGDMVDVWQTANDGNSCWYSGQINLASGTKYLYRIRMDSGEIADIYPSLVRPHTQPELNAVVEYSTSKDDSFHAAIVVETYVDGSLDIIPYDTSTVIHVARSQIRKECE